MTAILGISAFYHDSAAALVVDGRIVAAAQEERFTRRKQDEHFPARAVEYCLREAGLEIEDLDHLGFYEKPLSKFDRLLETYLSFAPSGYRSFRQMVPLWLRQKLHLPRELDRELSGRYRHPYVFLDHHESHAASAFFPSPFEEAAILTLDGDRERCNRRIARLTLAATPLLMLAALWIAPRFRDPPAPSPPLATSPAAAPAPIAKLIAGTPIRVINDEELLAVFQGRPIALLGEPGHQRLVLLDEMAR